MTVPLAQVDHLQLQLASTFAFPYSALLTLHLNACPIFEIRPSRLDAEFDGWIATADFTPGQEVRGNRIHRLRIWNGEEIATKLDEIRRYSVELERVVACRRA